jgi:hypothetical protein
MCVYMLVTLTNGNGFLQAFPSILYEFFAFFIHITNQVGLI